MSIMSLGYNKFKSTTVCGTFHNSDVVPLIGSITECNAIFDRKVKAGSLEVTGQSTLGITYLKQNPIYFSDDNNCGVIYDITTNGPQIFGYDGGVIGTKTDIFRPSLTWDLTKVIIPTLYLSDDAIDVHTQLQTLTEKSSYSGDITIPSDKLMTLNGNILAHTKTITPTKIAYLSKVSSDIQDQLDGLTNKSLFSGDITVPSDKLLTLYGNISANTKTITPTKIAYLSNVSSDIQDQFDALTQSIPSSSSFSDLVSNTTGMSYTGNIVNTTQFTSSIHILGGLSCDNALTCGSLGCGSLDCGDVSASSITSTFFSNTEVDDLQVQITSVKNKSNFSGDFAGNFTVNLGKVFTLTGNISSNAKTITPLCLSYVYGLSSNAQEQLDALNNNFTIPEGKNLTLNGNIIVNSIITITSLHLSYICGLTENVQFALNTMNMKLSGVLNNTIVAMQTAITTLNNKTSSLTVTGYSNNVTIPTGDYLYLNGNISANSLTITPIKLSYLFKVSSDIQDQLDRLTNKSLFSGDITVPINKLLTLYGNISANSLTITPTQIGYLSNLNNNVQQQINDLNTQTTGISYSYTVFGAVSDIKTAFANPLSTVGITDNLSITSPLITSKFMTPYNSIDLQSQITFNASNISTNTRGISTNATNISTNTTNISLNATNISTNAKNLKDNYLTTTQTNTKLLSYTQTPVGAMLTCIIKLSNPVSSGYLLCDGTLYLVSSYPTLAALLQPTYGYFGQTTNFYVPNLVQGSSLGTNTDLSTAGALMAGKIAPLVVLLYYYIKF